MRRRPRSALFALGAVTVLGLTGCSALADANPGAGSLGDVPAAPSVGFDAASALAKLDTLGVKGRAPKTGYSREQFGPSWSDDNGVEGGHNGCDTRNDILRRDLVDLTYKTSTRDCVVATGTLHDPYTGTTIAFVRGQDTSTAVQIDHVVALSDAWQKGAQQLSPEQRRDLANDPRNLQAVDGPTNSKKSDSDAASWLPPNKSYRCTYVSRQIDVKALYRLWVTQAEKDAMSQVLHSC
ncbi:HNH endonuclease (plasmid) [Rhodococcus oxybenzonivorans]|uniref:HNH endonuclease n=1 Tax=Rhodococcus oxybenzonivorans TaxID=1990687 RepID=A0A2S2C617_9NOCA|nr:HNH endonuclease family protein [Rhodococcus oxybenzonivorans]AWK76228.1 HNH endonuclease [Rhodococcus oxybenzonivorans]